MEKGAPGGNALLVKLVRKRKRVSYFVFLAIGFFITVFDRVALAAGFFATGAVFFVIFFVTAIESPIWGLIP